MGTHIQYLKDQRRIRQADPVRKVRPKNKPEKQVKPIPDFIFKIIFGAK